MSKILSIGKSKDGAADKDEAPGSVSKTTRSVENVCEISLYLTVVGLLLGLMLEILSSLPILEGIFCGLWSELLVEFSLWVLVLTPTAGLMAALVQYFKEQRWRFVTVIALLGIMLAMGAVIGGT